MIEDDVIDWKEHFQVWPVSSTADFFCTSLVKEYKVVTSPAIINGATSIA